MCVVSEVFQPAVIFKDGGITRRQVVTGLYDQPVDIGGVQSATSNPTKSVHLIAARSGGR